MTERTPGLSWGIKQSFVHYLIGLSDGRYLDRDGAAFAEPDLFTFEFDQVISIAGILDVARFRGVVVLTGHSGMLYVTITDPWIEFTPDGAILTIVDEETQGRFVLGKLALGPPTSIAGFMTWNSVPVALDAASEPLFNSQYPAGTALAPLSFSIPEMG